MFFPYELMGNQVGYVKLHQNRTAEPADPDTEVPLDPRMPEGRLELRNRNGTGPIRFSYSRIQHQPHWKQLFQEDFAVNVGYYQAADNTDHGPDHYFDTSNDAEGAYLFKPDRHKRYQLQYGDGNFTKLVNDSGRYIKQWQFHMYNSKNDSEHALLKVMFSPYWQNLIQFNLELNGIPVMLDKKGKDVVMNWHLYHFDNNQTFWTDSNGLEMQYRRLNWRPDYQYNTTWNGHVNAQNISANYYPVDSAIAIRNCTDPQWCERFTQLTIMNERSQGGSAGLTNGTIELVHNRRLLQDDARGVD